MKLSHKFWLTVAVGGLVAIVGPYLVVGRLPYTEMVWLVFGHVGLPLTVISFVLALFPRARDSAWPGYGLSIVAVMFLALLGGPHADQVKRDHNRHAKQYCRSLIPKLEAYRAEHGEYPDEISALPDKEAPPHSVYLREKYYFKGTNSFVFSWADSPGISICSGVTSYHHQSQYWDSCADWGGE
mgnify:CR=1 FL=1